MTDTAVEDLDVMEARVYRRYAAAVAASIPAMPDFSAWLDMLSPPTKYTVDTALVCADTVTQVPQFPPQRWITYPARRRMCLVLVDQMLNRIDDGNTAHDGLTMAGILLTFGGRSSDA
ncbi:Uncharacterised protein [Mycobacteroides abscessus subsp. abscessus]|uniref:hypothetical protein n=1 Tax=Mycobacteroides abscessus TaxID=36809 RepID=UPI0009A81223|nr:hypothetical protein [Mycobacteroides abscessus]SLJ40566.1 Uncharacterised protein [Mycobacteroides abscessus subsp. abscessus]